LRDKIKVAKPNLYQSLKNIIIMNNFKYKNKTKASHLRLVASMLLLIISMLAILYSAPALTGNVAATAYSDMVVSALIGGIILIFSVPLIYQNWRNLRKGTFK
jgi:hypothetical protein